MIAKVLALSMTSAVLALLVRERKPVFAMLIAITGGLGMLLMVLKPLTGLIGTLQTMTQNCGETELFLLGIRVTGMALVCDFAADICREAGEEQLSKKTLFAGKIIIMAAGMPSALELLGSIRSWLGFS